MHIWIVKPPTYYKDYYYHKIGGYNVAAQVVVDCKKMFTYVFVEMMQGVYTGLHYTKMPNTTCLFESHTSFQ
jgi:hypothetical protein